MSKNKKTIDLWDLVEHEGEKVIDIDGDIATIIDVFAEDGFCILEYGKGKVIKVGAEYIKELSI